VTEAELARAKRLIRAQFVFGNEQVSSQAITLGFYETIYRFEYLSECQSLIESVTADDVQAAARQYLDADNRTVGHLICEGVMSA
jgi:predicted Zn-dependent peptidase